MFEAFCCGNPACGVPLGRSRRVYQPLSARGREVLYTCGDCGQVTKAVEGEREYVDGAVLRCDCGGAVGTKRHRSKPHTLDRRDQQYECAACRTTVWVEEVLVGPQPQSRDQAVHLLRACKAQLGPALFQRISTEALED